MSYILDALKKSDRDRDRQLQAPRAPVSGTPEFRAGRRSGAGRLRICGLVVLMAGAAWGGFGLARLEPGADFRTTVQALPSPVVPPPPAPSADTKVQDLAAVSTGNTPPANVPAATPPTDSADSSGLETMPREGLLELWQLTDAEQKYLQGLDVSFHVHSNDPAQRAVIINGLRAKEGQALGEDLRLAEIVPDGIILEFQGQRVHLGNPQPY